jgi:hypothetical protein
MNTDEFGLTSDGITSTPNFFASVPGGSQWLQLPSSRLDPRRYTFLFPTGDVPHAAARMLKVSQLERQRRISALVEIKRRVEKWGHWIIETSVVNSYIEVTYYNDYLNYNLIYTLLRSSVSQR